MTALVNQKGGVGKTTVALGLASALSARGARVLVVDLDPQANATSGMGVWEPTATIDVALLADRSGSAASAVHPSGWQPLDGTEAPSVVASSPSLAQVEHQLVSDVIGAQDRLSVALHGVLDEFDEVLIDCPPSLGLLTVNALFCADRVLVVTEPAAWSSDGVEQILRNVERISQRRGGVPSVAGIVINRLARTRDAAYWAEELRSAHRDLVLSTAIRLRAAVTEAAAQSLPMHAMARSGSEEAIGEFESLAAELFVSVSAAEPSSTDPTAAASDAEPAAVAIDLTATAQDRVLSSIGSPGLPGAGGEADPAPLRPSAVEAAATEAAADSERSSDARL